MKIGIDLGGMSIKAGLIDDALQIVHKESVPTDTQNGKEKLASDIVELIESVRRKYPEVEISGVGIGVPGHVDKNNGLVYNCNNIPLEHINLHEFVNARTGLAAWIDNDANVAALGEVLAGAARNYSDAVLITIGTGIGSGIVLNNQIYRGCNGAAGELGHDVIVAGGRPCNCGRRGCYEQYASATALIEDTRAAMRANPDSLLWSLVEHDLQKVNGKTAFDAWRQGDPVGTTVVEAFIYYLGVGIINIINNLQPEAIIIGGGISKEGDTLLNLLAPIVAHERYSQAGVQTELVIAALGNDAGIIGASQII